MASRRLTDEHRALRAQAKQRTVGLKEQLRIALRVKKERLRELVKTIRAERLALRARLQATRSERLAEIRSWEAAERAKARAAWQEAMRAAREETDGEIARARAQVAAESAHEAEIWRIGREVSARAKRHLRLAHSDDEVRAVVPPELLPLFERIKASIRATLGESRAETFLRMAAQRPDDVFRLVEPRLERLIVEVSGALAEARTAAVLSNRKQPANGNGLLGGGPLPAEEERIRQTCGTNAREQVKSAGLDVVGVAKLVRADIHSAVKDGSLPKAKYSVRTDKYSMGSSIDVVVSRLPFPVLNPEAFRVEPGASYVTFDSANYRTRFTQEARRVEEKLDAIIDAYHWDRSDPTTDYYNERFARDVRLTEDRRAWQAIETAKVAAALATRLDPKGTPQ